MGLEIVLLGRPTVVDDGTRHELAGRQPALLARLAVSAPDPVSVDVLVDVLWGDTLPADPANALQQRISSLRKLLDPDRDGALLATTPGGYALRVEDDRIDARRFARWAARGGRLLAEGDAEAALSELRNACELWGGEPLEGLAHETWAQAEVARLTELHWHVMEERFEAALRLGAGKDLVADLRAAIELQPLRERLAGQLMLALYRAGRQADALEVYDRTRRQLVDELGVDPGPGLQRVYRRLLDQIDDVDVALPPTGGTSAVATTRVDNLPVGHSPLVGRDTDIAALDQHLDQTRLVTVTGPGGCGKTSLVLEAARRRPRPVHGTWWVPLADLADASALAGHVAAALDLPVAGLGEGQPHLDTWIRTLADRQLLLVLDNAEHLADAVADLAARLLAAAPGVRILVTSREPLGLDGEQTWPLAPLATPAETETDPDAIVTASAVRLLLARIRQHDPWFVLGDEYLADAAELVRRLDGLPLAIELAAAQLRVLSLPQLLDHLDADFDRQEGRRAASPRQRSLHGALAWSWDLLSDDERAAWMALATPVGAFDLDTAACLLAAAGLGDPVAIVRRLAERSLLTVVGRGTAGIRYRMLTTIRAHGRDRVAGTPLASRLETAHADLVEGRLAGCHDHLDPARFGVDLAGLGALLDEARAVLDRSLAVGDRTRAQRVAGQLGWLWLLSGLADEGRAWLDRALGPVAAVDPGQADPAALLWASGLRVGHAHGDGEAWNELASATLTRPDERVMAVVFAGIHHMHRGELDAGWASLDEAVSAAGEVGGWSEGFARLLRAQVGRLTGRFDEVPTDATAARELLVDPELAWGRAYAADILVDVALSAGPTPNALTDARALAEMGLRWCADQRLPELEARLRLQLARTLHGMGDHDRARRHLDDAVALATATGGPGLAFVLLVAGGIARQQGELELAERQLTEAVALMAGSAAPFGPAEANLELALTRLEAGDVAGAATAAATARTVGATLPGVEFTERLDALDAALVAAAHGDDRNVTVR